MRWLLPAWLLGLAFASLPTLQAQGVGFLRKDILLASSPETVLWADLNGDERPDLVVALLEGWVTAMNDGQGNFAQIVRHSSGLYGAVVADFNGDGRNDLVAGISNALLLSNGDGTFLPPQIVSSGEPLAASDFNRDSNADLVVTTNGTGAQVLLGNGDGTFQPGPTLTSERVTHAEADDFNGDGRIDIAAFVPGDEWNEGFALVFLSSGDGAFGPGVRTPIEPWGYEGVLLTPFLVADFNGDALPDLSAGKRILLGQGDGGFREGPAYPIAVEGIHTGTFKLWGMYPIGAADLDGDGYADLVTRDTAVGSLVWIFSGDPDGELGEPIVQPVGYALPGFFVGSFLSTLPPLHRIWTAVDLNGDGRRDLVTANNGSNTVSILMATEPGAPALRRAVSAADMYVAAVAPGSLATLFAPTGVASNMAASPPWPSQLDDVELIAMDRTGGLAGLPLLFVSPNQINFQVPEGMLIGEAKLLLGRNGETIEIGGMDVVATSPRLFYTQMGPAASVVRIEPDGTQTPLPIIQCVGPEPDPCSVWQDAAIPLSSAAGRPIYLSLYGTGFRGANETNVTCTLQDVGPDLSGKKIPVIYAGSQEIPGVDQMNILLRSEEFVTPQGPYTGSVSLLLELNGAPANWVTFGVE